MASVDKTTQSFTTDDLDTLNVSTSGNASSRISDFAGALRDWARLLGAEHVVTGEQVLERYSLSTLPKSTRPRAVIRPASSEEVQRAVCIAAEHGVPLYPISRGKNWGYGDACAPTDGQVIVDLGRMNRILEVNPELAYAVVEPGVTQQQMCDYLREKGYPLWLDVTGAGPEASIVGNTLERGFGHTPYGDHFAHTCGMEVVLGDGTLLRTGFGAYDNAQADRVFPWGVGPWIDGLFTQSNMGIVTRMNVWLMPAQQTCQGFAFKVHDERQLADVIDALRLLRLQDVVRSTVHVANDLRVISARRQYPWDLAAGITPLPDSIRAKLRREAGLGAWNVLGGLYGTREMVAAARKSVRRGLRHVARVHFFGERLLRIGLAATSLLNRFGLAKELRETIHSAASVYQLLKGQPSLEHLNGAFWRTDLSTNSGRMPDPVHSGVLWLSPVLPMTGHAAEEVMSIARPVLKEYGFDPLLTFISVTSRALISVMSIYYDKRDARDAEKAQQCYNRLYELFAARGYLPYRVGSQSMHLLSQRSEQFWEVAHRLSRTLDPAGILAPGRYQPNVGK